MEKRSILTDKAPKAIGPYSQAVTAGGFIFTAGQVPIDPATGKIAEGGIEAQTRQSMNNIKAILEAAGSKLENIVKTTIFVIDLNDFPKVNEVYGSFFKDNPPARSTVQVSRLPLDVKVEIEAVALL
ncbi:RidA family protein [bacterium]|nr:RidA family protein [bacterium]